MFTIKAKYNSADVMLKDESFIDDETKKQIYGFLNHPAFIGSKISIMPDCHAGAGSCIGFTMKRNQYLIPNIVGVDIGCGMYSTNLGDININLQRLDNFIRGDVPSGFNVRKDISDRVKSSELEEEIKSISGLIGSDSNRNMLSIGTLGGGNHFIEIGIDENKDKWLTIHSGSRKFGLDIAKFHQDIAQKEHQGYKELAYLENEENIKLYLQHMEVAQRMASVNRLVITIQILSFLKLEGLTGIECIHNYISFKDNIIRKGAISAYKNEDVIIPFNMEDGLIIGKGLGNSEWNYSAPHGAGRLLSRKKAKETLNLESAKERMKEAGIFTTSLSNATLDEVKGAYKDKDMILEALKEAVQVTHFVKPLYNFKAEN